jgi:hypothetical protein
MHGTVNHQHNCNKVVGTLKEKFSDRFAVGIIDKDKVQVGYLKECDLVISSEHLQVLKHRVFPHFIVTVSPAMDAFLLDCAKEQGVQPEHFKLSSDLKKFICRSKKITSNKDEDLKSLIIAIKDNKEMKSLGMTLRYLQEKKYNFDLDVIKSFFHYEPI